ncbi:MAG: TfoX/Sxy family protein [Pseudomonadota bacterium]
MSNELRTIRNIGPAMEAALRAVAVKTAEQLRELGPDAAYKRLVDSGERPHFIAYYALVMGLQGRPWNDCQGKEKEDLRRRFDALVATKPPSNQKFLKELDDLGIRLGDLPTQ